MTNASPYVTDSLLDELDCIVQSHENEDGHGEQIFFLLPNGRGLSALPRWNNSVAAITWEGRKGGEGFTYETVGLAPGQFESFDSVDEIPDMLRAVAAL